MAPSETLKRFINDPNGPGILGQSLQGPKPQLPPITTITSEPSLSLKEQTLVSKSRSSERSTSPSISPGSSILSRRESGSSNTSTAPSDAAESLVGNVERMSIGGHNRLLPCLLCYIINCPITYELSERGDWYLHSLSHYGDAGPPTHAMCIFCDAVFDSSNPAICWSKRMNHIANHFEDNWTIEMSRPDFGVIKDMRNKGWISEEDYKHASKHTERPACDGLRPYNYIPKEIEKKQRAAYDQANRVPVRESRQEIRDRQRGIRQPVVGSKKLRLNPIPK